MGQENANPREHDDFAEALEGAKQGSVLQLLFRVARRVDEEALRRIASAPGRPQLRRSHTSLFPHIDLEGTRLTVLAVRLGITKQAVSQLVDELERVGVLGRIPDPTDGRARLIVFTDAGRQGLFEGLALLDALAGELSQVVGAARMDELHRTLLQLDEALPLVVASDA